MKILVSAYACNPYGGSEPGVGWAAVCRIATKHDVYVLADIHNKPGWDRASEEGTIPKTVRVRFIRDKASAIRNPFIAHIDSWLSYAAFNRQILDAALDWNQEIGFDLCHQVTIAGWRMPSPLWRLPIPFVWGPIGGAGYIPREFRCILSPQARCFEFARDIQTWLASRSRDFLSCIRESAVVIAANEETEEYLSAYRNNQPLVRLAIASVSPEKASGLRRPSRDTRENGPLRLFAGGYMEGRKGVSLALRALVLVQEAGIDFRYTVAGIGPEIKALRRMAITLGIGDKVIFHEGYRGDDYRAKLWESDVYFLPSFRESTPVTLLEACLAGCYPVVADTSAQGEIVRLAGGTAVPTSSLQGLITGLSRAILWCADHRQELHTMTEQITATITEHFGSERYDHILSNAYMTALSRD